MPHSLNSIFIVIPSYNEEKVLPAVLAPFISKGYSIVVVDDGSVDGTWALLQKLPVHALRHAFNMGQGASLQTGMTYALYSGAQYIVHFDADGQHQPEAVEKLLEPLLDGKSDVSLGSRFLLNDDRQRVPKKVQIVLKMATVVNGLISGLWLTDAHNGLRALTGAAAKTIHLKQNRYAHATEILAQIKENNLRVIEVPTKILYTAYSISKGQRLRNAINIMIDLMLSWISK